MSYNFSLLSFNVNGLGDSFKRRCIFNWIRNHFFNFILFLQETHTTPICEKKWEFEWGSKIFFSHGESNCRGVAILIPPQLDYHIIDTDRDTNGRYLKVTLEINDTKFVMTNIYAPTKDHPTDQYAFFEFLADKLFLHCHENLIIGGDFNITLNPSIDKKEGEQRLNLDIGKTY